MNKRQRSIIENAISSYEEDLRRAEATKQRNPNWRGGSGETIDTVIAGYKKIITELKE